MGECIAQLRWVSFRKLSQPLSHVQLYDSASRGPWGSLSILIKDKFRSLVTLGAFIVLLALAFDPFAQQLISYPVQPTLSYSTAAHVLQSRYLLQDIDESVMTYAINHGMWSDSEISLNPTCPTGNCTWPHFRSVEMCSKCTDIDTSRIDVSGWDLSSFNYSLNRNQSIPTKISILDSKRHEFSIAIEFWDNDPADYALWMPKYVYWFPEFEGDDWMSVLGSAFQNSSEEADNPFPSIASVEFAFPNISAINNSDFLSEVTVIKANLCALSICAKEYDVSVKEGVSSVQVLHEDFGVWYLATSAIAFPYAIWNTCWRPTSSPETDWDITGGIDDLSGGSVDLPNFEFCGVDSSYYEEIYNLQGTMVNPATLYNFSSTSNGSSGYWNIPNYDWGLTSFGSTTARMHNVGMEKMIANVASSLSAFARKVNKNPIYGIVSTQESYVAVKWEWMILPAVLLAAGIFLLIATALISTRGEVRLWKSSALPLIFHGLEPGSVSQIVANKNGQWEAVSEMEVMADKMIVDLGISSEAGRTVFRDTA